MPKISSRTLITGAVVVFTIAVTYYIFCLPKDLFKDQPYSTVVTDRNGELLGARIAVDGQWRFPPTDSLSSKYKISVIEFEDQWFRYHRGINPVSICRALIGNIKAGHIQSGGSTISMQVIRLSRNRSRNICQKAIEAILATRLDRRYSKDEILNLYASHAPFGGNVVGIEAASWRYFGRPSTELSWGEAATLAILPNSPSSIHLGKKRESLLAKRNRLLKRLYQKGYISESDYSSAKDEPLPDKPMELPHYAHHFVNYQHKYNKGEIIRSTIDLNLQQKVENITDSWNSELRMSGINDLAAVVIDVRSGEIVAYCGNANIQKKRDGSEVDIAISPRSTGSILKPILYCALLQDGSILPHTLLPDIPVNINGFSPQNYNLQFAGAVPANEALARSLNVPAVHMLRKYGVAKFKDLLQEAGMTTLNRSAADYGLSLILGGAEGKLLDITRIYANLAHNYISKEESSYILNDKAAVWHTFEALTEVNRPDEIDWKLISSIHKVAWKTGTSYGFRDAWAVGVTPEYAVGVWVGNAQGQGVPGLAGASTAGPVMFDIFNCLEISGIWFSEPSEGEYIEAEVCPESGHLRGIYCPNSMTIKLPKAAMNSDPCKYHKVIDSKPVFVLPPGMEWYYRQRHPDYQVPKSTRQEIMEFIYPDNGSRIYIPRQLDGSIKGIVFNLAHREPETIVFWHLDNEFIGQTKNIHQMSATPEPGRHRLTCVDASGNSQSVYFSIEKP